ncbi:hypothetical protein PR048_006820 [Dryococelus australis]|uniref:Uncharacterized protein n=1 Tax=Dryococelus australis TaxID=614101 RepID=A0ABQ9IBZ8_9NEOP|nr:hypothetical protein PR048_006820 [Dryococelus australis]
MLFQVVTFDLKATKIHKTTVTSLLRCLHSQAEIRLQVPVHSTAVYFVSRRGRATKRQLWAMLMCNSNSRAVTDTRNTHVNLSSSEAPLGFFGLSRKANVTFQVAATRCDADAVPLERRRDAIRGEQEKYGSVGHLVRSDSSVPEIPEDGSADTTVQLVQGTAAGVRLGVSCARFKFVYKNGAWLTCWIVCRSWKFRHITMYTKNRCVPGCENRKESRHRFPRVCDAESFELGNFAHISNEHIYKVYRICICHFSTDCFGPGDEEAQCELCSNTAFARLFHLRSPSTYKKFVLYNYFGLAATVAERLACSPPTKAIGAPSPAGSLRIFAYGYSAGRCNWLAGLLEDLPFSSPFHYSAAPYSPQSPPCALQTSMLRAAEISSLTLLDWMMVTWCSATTAQLAGWSIGPLVFPLKATSISSYGHDASFKKVFSPCFGLYAPDLSITTTHFAMKLTDFAEHLSHSLSQFLGTPVASFNVTHYSRQVRFLRHLSRASVVLLKSQTCGASPSAPVHRHTLPVWYHAARNTRAIPSVIAVHALALTFAADPLLSSLLVAHHQVASTRTANPSRYGGIYSGRHTGPEPSSTCWVELREQSARKFSKQPTATDFSRRVDGGRRQSRKLSITSPVGRLNGD